MCENVCLCICIWFLCYFFVSFSSICLFYLILVCLVLCYLILLLFLDAYLFSNERKGMDLDERGGGQNLRSWGGETTIMRYEKKYIFSIKEKRIGKENLNVPLIMKMRSNEKYIKNTPQASTPICT